jgi:hypothetical protein
MEMSLRELEGVAGEFAESLAAVRASTTPSGGWYLYGSLANLSILAQLQAMTESIPNVKRIADIGAADGDLGIFLASQGFEVDLVDHAPTNANHLEGARILAGELAPSTRIFDVNLDEGEDLPASSYDFVLFLGILYHLQNPFSALKRLSSVSKEMVLSTKVAACDPEGRAWFGDQPVAYLVDEYECNGDPTNYWIFSNMGLRRLVNRAGWDVVSELSLGAVGTSEPASMEKDERTFMWLRSRSFPLLDG